MIKNINRFIDLQLLVARKSLFLLGPRRTGKSTLISQQLPKALTFDLLDSSVYRAVSANPELIRNAVRALPNDNKIVVIDEIQLLPQLLNEVHLMIERDGIRFVLTGSSARALRRKGANLLAGRARTLQFRPFVRAELEDQFDLIRAINHGLIPSHYFSEHIEQDLSDYVGTYLKEEVAAEGMTRNMPAFSRFLEVAALSNGTMLNYTNIASDAEVKRLTVMGYFDILRDTLVGVDLPAWQQSKKRKPIVTAKFFFFDPGVTRFLRKEKSILPGSPAFGASFEHYIFHELKSWCDYHGAKPLHYWRSKSNFEVDFILDEQIAIEAKAKQTISAADFSGLKALREEQKTLRCVLVYLGKQQLNIDGIEVLPYEKFLDELWVAHPG